MGDCYVSVVTFRETELQESPIVPLMYMLHERKFQVTHEWCFLRLKTIVPELAGAKRVVIVTDEGASIVNALERQLPLIPRFRCWLHALADIKRKLASLGIRDRATVRQYRDDFIDLLKQKSYSQYNAALIEKVSKWDRIFFTTSAKTFTPT